MNLGEIWIRVQRLFGDESGAQITEADITRWANDGQVDIVRRTEILQSHREANIVADDRAYELPDDFMFMVRATLDGVKLTKTTMQDLDFRSSSIDTAAAGTPGYFYTWNQSLFLYPPPDSGGTGNLDIWYVKTPAVLEVEEDIPEIPVHMHEDLVRYCVSKARELDADFDGAERSLMDYESRVSQTRHELSSQTLDSYPSIRLIPGDEG